MLHGPGSKRQMKVKEAMNETAGYIGNETAGYIGTKKHKKYKRRYAACSCLIITSKKK